MRVKLFFTVGRNPKLEKKVKGIEIIRLKCWVQFKKTQGWTDPYRALVDTGAPISLIPFSLWDASEHKVLADHSVSGVVPKPECSIPIKVGTLSCKLVDTEGHESKEMEIHAYFALNDDVPLILGFKDVLARFPHFFDYPQRDAYLEA
ncbi:hypothetical protein HYR54_07495 [Candidatus Acetothermia bacterium]|nr:hypothetical protein [Candidatus Acetothermia bacterium]